METKTYTCPRCGKTSETPDTCVHGERGELPYQMTETPLHRRLPLSDRYDGGGCGERGGPVNIELLAAEIVTALDTNAKESPSNRAEVVKGILLRAMEPPPQPPVPLPLPPGQPLLPSSPYVGDLWPPLYPTTCAATPGGTP